MASDEKNSALCFKIITLFSRTESDAGSSHGPRANIVASFLCLLFLQSVQDHLGGNHELIIL